MPRRHEAEDQRSHTIESIAEGLGVLPGVVAVALGGSVPSGVADTCSDIDLYVYAPEPPPLEARRALVEPIAATCELDNQAFGTGDEWVDAATGLRIDVMHWGPAWIEEQLARVLDEHRASAGYSTAFWRTVLHSKPLVDPTGWFATLKRKANRPYPEPLRRAIISLNLPLLRGAQSSFLHQIACAIDRDDALSVNHRTAALLASYVDILFALNRVPHPGEKRQIEIARQECDRLPPDLDADLAALIAAVPPPWRDGRLLAAANRLIEGLETLVPIEAVHEGHQGNSAAL
jgi:hypothetical protein